MSIASISTSLPYLGGLNSDTDQENTNTAGQSSQDDGGSETTPKVSVQITKVSSQPNANGTTTVTTTYADGTTRTSLKPNPVPVSGRGTLSSNNGGQLAALLFAQEQTQHQNFGPGGVMLR